VKAFEVEPDKGLVTSDRVQLAIRTEARHQFPTLDISGVQVELRGQDASAVRFVVSGVYREVAPGVRV
jgi:hypothetical protein